MPHHHCATVAQVRPISATPGRSAGSARLRCPTTVQPGASSGPGARGGATAGSGGALIRRPVFVSWLSPLTGLSSSERVGQEREQAAERGDLPLCTGCDKPEPKS